MRTVKQLKNFSSSIFRYLITFCFSFFTRKLFIDALGVEYLGVSGLMGNILGMLAIAELGIGASIVFSLYKPLAEKDQQKVHLLIALYRKLYGYIALVVLFIGLLLMPFLTDFSPDLVNIPHYNIIYLMCLANSVIPYYFAYNSTLYSATQQGYKLENIHTAFYVISMGITITILTYWPNYILLTACSMLLGITSQILIYFMARRHWPWLRSIPKRKLPDEDLRTIKKNVRAMVLHKIGDYSINGTSSLIIANAINLAAVGMLANYTTVTNLLKTLVGQFFNAMIAGTGELIATESKEKVYAVFQEINFLAFWFFGLAMTGTYFCCDQFINIWLGDGFNLTRIAILFLAIDIFVMGMRVPPHIIKAGAGLFSNDQYAPLFQAAINISVGIYLARQWGIAGVTFSILLSGLCVPSWFRPYMVYRDYFKKSFLNYVVTYISFALILAMIFITLSYVFSFYLPADKYAEFAYRVIIVLILYHLFITTYGACTPQGRACFIRLHRVIYPIYTRLCRNH